MSEKARKLPSRLWPLKVRLQYIPAVQAEILYFRLGSEDRGRERRSPSPPSEPGVRFSRDGLSSRLFPHRGWRANM